MVGEYEPKTQGRLFCWLPVKKSKTMVKRRKYAGMTLLEVLVALAIFATAAMSVIRAVSQHINTVGYLEQKMFAAMVNRC